MEDHGDFHWAPPDEGPQGMAFPRYKYTCPTCFAAVRENKADDHKAWHDAIENDLQELNSEVATLQGIED